MNRIKLLIVVLFLAALGTGFLVGMGVARSKTLAGKGDSSPNPRATTRPSLTDALALTPQQSEQLKTIWTDWDPTRQTRMDRHQQFQKERDEAIQSLLSDQQKAAYETVQKNYRAKLDQLDAERKQAFQAAVEKTKAILTDAQKTKYEEILKNGPPGGPGRGPRNSADRRSGRTSQPSTAPLEKF